jgi:SNF family Na+-dependent transporter
MIPIGIYFYYLIIESWCLAYATNYLLGNLHFNDTDEAVSFFHNLVGVFENGSAISFDLNHLAIFVIIALAINFHFVSKGISKGIERFCVMAMPLLLVIALVILVRVITLGTPDASKPNNNISSGLGYMWNPSKTVVEVRDSEDAPWVFYDQLLENTDADTVLKYESEASISNTVRIRHITLWELLCDPKLWLAAASQIFFSLSVGFGIIITYASYLKPKDDVVLSGLAASSTNEFFEVAVGGMISIPAAVAFFGITGLAGIGLGTFDIGFKVLPMVFTQMPSGQIFGFLFFFLLFLAAITSSLSMLQPAMAFFEDNFGMDRKKATTAVFSLTSLGVLFVLYNSADLKALDTLDYWISNLLMVFLATVQVIIFGWIIGIDKGIASAHQGAKIRIPKVYAFIIKYITPCLLIFILCNWLWDILSSLYKNGSNGSTNSYINDLVINPNPVALQSVGILLLLGLFIAWTIKFKNDQ